MLVLGAFRSRLFKSITCTAGPQHLANNHHLSSSSRDRVLGVPPREHSSKGQRLLRMQETQVQTSRSHIHHTHTLAQVLNKNLCQREWIPSSGHRRFSLSVPGAPKRICLRNSGEETNGLPLTAFAWALLWNAMSTKHLCPRTPQLGLPFNVRNASTQGKFIYSTYYYYILCYKDSVLFTKANKMTSCKVPHSLRQYPTHCLQFVTRPGI